MDYSRFFKERSGQYIKYQETIKPIKNIDYYGETSQSIVINGVWTNQGLIKSNCHEVFAVVAGEGVVIIDNNSYIIQKGDVFIAPSNKRLCMKGSLTIIQKTINEEEIEK